MPRRHRLRSILTLTFVNGILPIRSQPLYLINLVGQPLSFLFFITIASSGKLYPYAIGGGMLMTILSIGTSLQTDISHYKTDLKLQDVMIASPVEEWVYVAGLALSELVYSLPGMGVFVALWILGGWATPVAALTLAGVLILIWAFSSSLGFTLATYFQDVRETFVFSSVISLSLSVIPPVYYPISYLPAWLRPYAWLSPTTYAADLIHGTVGVPGPSFIGAVTDWGVLIGFTLGLLLLASFKARWREP
jgi:ABC-2 type transport system permease protein